MEELDRVNRDALSEIFEDIGIVATDEQIDKAAKDFDYHLQMMRETACWTPSAPSSIKESCSECERLRDEIKCLEGQIECYRKSVMDRTGANEVWIGNYGEVRYDY